MFNFLKNYSKNEEKFITALKGNNNNADDATAVCTSYINNLFTKFKKSTNGDERTVIKEFMVRFYVQEGLPEETWREVKTDLFHVEISNWCRCRFLAPYGHYKAGDIYRPSINNEGYVCGLQTCMHCIAAKAFIGERPDGLVVDHINGCNCDNRAENLQYLTFGDNIRKGYAARKKTGKNKQQYKRRTTAVEQYDKEGKLIAVYPTAAYAAKVNGWKDSISSSISKSCRNGNLTKGFTWKRQSND